LSAFAISSVSNEGVMPRPYTYQLELFTPRARASL